MDSSETPKRDPFRRIAPLNWCDAFWGSHGCSLRRGHHGPHICHECSAHSDVDGLVYSLDEDGQPCGEPYVYGPELWGADVPGWLGSGSEDRRAPREFATWKLEPSDA